MCTLAFQPVVAGQTRVARLRPWTQSRHAVLNRTTRATTRIAAEVVEVDLKVIGMTCGHCTSAVQSALEVRRSHQTVMFNNGNRRMWNVVTHGAIRVG